ncbi:MAG: cation transporter dimerization domain-containing protein, partial [Clostridia bacterium]|nr:cation transporter dimerization domain-containing protein [Clostridia bacterium]
GLAIDGWAGLAVALFIFYAGIRAARETIGPLLGQPPTRELVERIESIVLAAPEVVGVHDLVVPDYGPGRRIVSLHAEVPADGDILALHDAVDNLEKRLKDTLGCAAVIHMDPVVTGDENVDRYKAVVTELVEAIDPRLSIHDFRYVPGTTHTNLVFDVVAPYGLGMSDEALKKAVAARVRALEGNYYAVVDIDKSSLE